MDLGDFEQQLSRMQERVLQMQLLSETPASRQQPAEIMAAAFQELSIALEELHVAHKELNSSYQTMELQNQQLLVANQALIVERQRYQELFEAAPDAYLVTDTDGVIQEANSAAVKLLNRSKQSLARTPLAIYVAASDAYFFARHSSAFEALLLSVLPSWSQKASKAL